MGTGFFTYPGGMQVKGKYQYQMTTATSWLVTGLSEDAAEGYDMGGTLAEGEIMQNARKTRVDASGQWHVSWDACVLGAWTAGRFPGDTDIPIPPPSTP
jgi:hypothetical protein